MKKKYLTFVVFFSLLFLFLSFSLVFAQDRELEVEYPEVGGIKPETVTVLLPEYVKYIFNFGIAIFGLVVFAVLVWAGVIYLTSAGQPAKLKAAREQIFSAFLGIVILLSSYLILTTINPQLAIFPSLPFLKPPEFCKNDRDCQQGYECKEGKCVMRESCTQKEDCPIGYECINNECFREEGPTTIISYEIPLGQMIESGIWDKTRIEATQLILDGFEKFLKGKESVGIEKSISDLNKKLKQLTEDCRCDVLTASCTSQATGGQETVCAGNPCDIDIKINGEEINVRDEIEKILKENEERVKTLEAYKRMINGELQKLKKAENKYFTSQEEFRKCLEKGTVLTRNEYLAMVEFYENQGWKTKVVPITDIPSRGDPLTFYCSIGGTMFDLPKKPFIELPEELYPEEIAPEMMEFEPLSCPAVIPVGEMLEETAFGSFKIDNHLDILILYIDELIKEIQNLRQLVSECNVNKCDVECSNPLENWCFRFCGGPALPCSNPACHGPWGPFAFCEFYCALSPGLTSPAGDCKGINSDSPYHGSPCPRDDIEEIVGSAEKPKEIPGRIKSNEDMIFEMIKEVKSTFSSTPYILETPDGYLDLLTAARAGADLCFNQDVEKEPTWALLDCAMAVGNYGPDGNIIADCHPQSFFCCSADKKAVAGAKMRLPSFEPRIPGNYTIRPIFPSVSLLGECSVDYTFTEAAQPCGWVQLPDNPPYISSYSIKQRRWGKPELVSMITAVAKQMYENYNKILRIGDWSGKCKKAGPPHKSHGKGIDVDISVREPYLTTEYERIALAETLIKCGASKIGYSGQGSNGLSKPGECVSTKEGDRVRKAVNEWAISQGYPGKMVCWGNHAHFHVRIPE